MLNNQRLSEFSKESLRYQTYENRIIIYDKNCLQCPFSYIQVKIGDRIIDVPTVEIAIKYCIDNDKAHIVRACSADAGYSLVEITSNTCMLWYPEGEDDEDECI